MHGRGFLLVEATLSLLTVSVLSLLVFSWHMQLLTRQKSIYHTLQALCLARSVLDCTSRAKEYRADDRYRYTVDKQNLLPTYTEVTVTVYHSHTKLLSLTSGFYHGR